MIIPLGLLIGAVLTPVIASLSVQTTIASTTPTPPFLECPAVGADSSCALLINLTDGGPQILADATQGPYDGDDDTLIGIVNNSSASVSSIPLSSSTLPIFGFDGDGICTYIAVCSGNTSDTTGYGGPNSYFTDISADTMSGTVDFVTPLAPGSSTYFSLEDALNATSFTVDSVSTSLSGGGQSGTSISVPPSTPVTDSATVSGVNASTATGTVTYSVYSNSTCTTAVSTGSPEKIITPGTMPDSSPVTLSTPGTYYWSATYSGDSANAPSTSTCGTTGEVETVASSTPVPVGAAGGLGLAAVAGAGFLVLQRRRRPSVKRAHAS
jgi:hypothetical protein